MIKIKKISSIIFIFLFFFANTKAEIQDKLFATIGDKAITTSDIVNEIKIILILNNMPYSEEKSKELQQMAVKSIIKRTIKEIEVNKKDFLQYDEKEFNERLNALAKKLDITVENLKEICKSNDLDFNLIKGQIEIELLWNSLIFYTYKNRIRINVEEIDDQLKLIQNKEEFNEYLISEIIINSVEKSEIETKITELKKKIEDEGFEETAMSVSISKSALSGGDLGWLNENSISKKFKPYIVNTPIGGLSETILLQEGMLIFKIRDKRKMVKNLSLEESKNMLVNSEKSKILNMYAMSHYDTLRRIVAIKFYND